MNLNDNTYQVLVFNIADELYALDILKVQEIVSYMKPYPIPNSPDYFEGVINLRSTIIPVIDLRIRLGFKENKHAAECVIVVVSIENNKYGVIVDSVSDVITVTKDLIQNQIDTHKEIESKYLEGIARNNNDMIILINIDKVFEKEELESMTSKTDNF